MSKFTGKICVYYGIEIMEGENHNGNNNCFQYMRDRIEYWRNKHEDSENELVKVMKKLDNMVMQIKNRWSIGA